MSQQITNFFTSIDLTETTPSSILQPNLSHTPFRRSPRNHDNNKKSYNIPKQKRKNQNPDHLKKENLTFKSSWQIG